MTYFDQLPVRRMKWFRESINGRIMAATITFAGLTVIVKAVTLGKEMLIARQFGAGNALDAFYIAFLLPSFLSNVVGDSFNAAFIPTYIEVREKHGTRAAQRLFSSVAAFSVTMLVATGLILAMFQGWLLPILASGFDPGKLHLARLLFFVLLASLPLTGLSTLWRAVFNAHDRFALPAFVPVMTPIVIVTMLLIASASWRIYALAIGAVLGVAGELVFCGCGLKSHGLLLLPYWYGLDASLRKVIGQYAPTVAGALLMGSTVLVDQSMAAMLGPGSVSALNYGNKLVAIPLNLGAYSLSVAVFPSFSRLSANADWSSMRHVLATYTRVIALAMVPLTVLFILFSEPLVALLFRGGAFTQEDAHLVARIQSFFCLQLPFYAIGVFYVRAISSLKLNQILMWGTVISVFVNVALNILFMRMFGLPGIALSTSAVYALSCGYLAMMLYRALRRHEAAVQSSYVMASADPVI